MTNWHLTCRNANIPPLIGQSFVSHGPRTWTVPELAANGDSVRGPPYAVLLFVLPGAKSWEVLPFPSLKSTTDLGIPCGASAKSRRCGTNPDPTPRSVNPFIQNPPRIYTLCPPQSTFLLTRSQYSTLRVLRELHHVLFISCFRSRVPRHRCQRWIAIFKIAIIRKHGSDKCEHCW
jgi:hypothetical protein